MIGRLHGRLLEVEPPHLLVDVQGVAYEVSVPMTTLYQLPELGADVTLLTHFAVTETAQSLYGFYSRQDRDLFRTLIKVNGVGPKMALSILSGLETNQLVACVADNNVAALVKVPGVGKKTAERLVIELRDRLKSWQVASSPEAGLAQMAESAAPKVLQNDLIAEAESALVALGYKPAEASKVIAKVSNDQTFSRSQDLIRTALKSLVPA